ncbi:hypothetical protein MUP59_00320, partial [Candidatus Bathyarchaeota archaeon]|nr:hypothetical protein [Candidatus Bathyarchaeota archaeon]
MSITEEMLVSVLGASIAVIMQAVILYRQRKRQRRTEERTSERIDRLSKVLKDASSEIDKLEREVNAKSKKLEELNTVSKRLDSLVTLKEEQVEAFRQ